MAKSVSPGHRHPGSSGESLPDCQRRAVAPERSTTRTQQHARISNSEGTKLSVCTPRLASNLSSNTRWMTGGNGALEEEATHRHEMPSPILSGRGRVSLPKDSSQACPRAHVHTVVGQRVEKVFLMVVHHVSGTQGQRPFDVRPVAAVTTGLAPKTDHASCTCNLCHLESRNNHRLGRMPMKSSLAQPLLSTFMPSKPCELEKSISVTKCRNCREGWVCNWKYHLCQNKYSTSLQQL